MERRILLAVLGSFVIACAGADGPVAPSSATNDVVVANGNVATFTGRGTAVDATVLGTNTKFCDVSLPRLGGRVESREGTKSISGTVSGSNLYCITGSRTNKATAEADGSALVITVGGNTITADRFKSMVGAECPVGSAPTNFGNAAVLKLVVNGKPIWVRNTPNQIVDLPNGYIVLWEQSHFVTQWHAGRTITALRVVVNKPELTHDIRIARSQAHIDCP